MRHLWAIRTLDRLLVHLFLSHDLSLLSCSLSNTPFYSIISSWTGVLPPRFQNAWEKAESAYEELLTYAQQKSLPAFISQTLNRLAILAVQQAHDKPKA